MARSGPTSPLEAQDFGEPQSLCIPDRKRECPPTDCISVFSWLQASIPVRNGAHFPLDWKKARGAWEPGVRENHGISIQRPPCSPRICGGGGDFPRRQRLANPGLERDGTRITVEPIAMARSSSSEITRYGARCVHCTGGPTTAPDRDISPWLVAISASQDDDGWRWRALVGTLAH